MKRLIAVVVGVVAALTLSAGPADAATHHRHHYQHHQSIGHGCITFPADGRFHPAVCRISKVVYR